MKVLSVNFSLVQRSRGHTSCERADYQMHGLVWDKKTNRYRDCWQRNTRHLFHRVCLPAGNTGKRQDVSYLWAAAARAEKRKDSVEARVVDGHFPRGFSYAAYARTALEIGTLFTARGVPVQVDVQVSTASDGLPDPHFHILMFVRQMYGDQVSDKKHDGLEKAFRADRGRQMRREIAAVINRSLGPNGPDLVCADKLKDAVDVEQTFPAWMVRQKDFFELLKKEREHRRRQHARLERRVENKIKQLERLKAMAAVGLLQKSTIPETAPEEDPTAVDMFSQMYRGPEAFSATPEIYARHSNDYAASLSRYELRRGGNDAEFLDPPDHAPLADISEVDHSESISSFQSREPTEENEPVEYWGHESEHRTLSEDETSAENPPDDDFEDDPDPEEILSGNHGLEDYGDEVGIDGDDWDPEADDDWDYEPD